MRAPTITYPKVIMLGSTSALSTSERSEYGYDKSQSIVNPNPEIVTRTPPHMQLQSPRENMYSGFWRVMSSPRCRKQSTVAKHDRAVEGPREGDVTHT